MNWPAFAYPSIALLLSIPLPGAQAGDTIRQGGKAAAIQASCEAKAVSWNIERGEQLRAVKATLAGLAPTLALLQEVDAGARRSGRVDVAAQLASELGLQYLFAAEFEELGQGRSGEPAYHGQAILTAHPTAGARVLRFRDQSSFWSPRWFLPNWAVFQRRKGGRLALAAEIGPEGRRLIVYDVHLESRGSADLRRRQMQEVVADIAKQPPGAPILVAGDFNTRERTEPAIHALEAAGFRKALGREVTTTRGAALDWVFVRGPVECSEAAILRSIRASDHFPLVFRVRWRGPEQ
jgi:endonuclease/exonuclease/phosphatase family metal-dependent hydrolase